MFYQRHKSHLFECLKCAFFKIFLHVNLSYFVFFFVAYVFKVGSIQISQFQNIIFFLWLTLRVHCKCTQKNIRAAAIMQHVFTYAMQRCIKKKYQQVQCVSCVFLFALISFIFTFFTHNKYHYFNFFNFYFVLHVRVSTIFCIYNLWFFLFFHCFQYIFKTKI